MKLSLLVLLVLVVLLAATFSAAGASHDWPSYSVCFTDDVGNEWELVFLVGEQLIKAYSTGPSFVHAEFTAMDHADQADNGGALGWQPFDWTGGAYGNYSPCAVPGPSTLGDVFGYEAQQYYVVFAGPTDWGQ